MSFSEISSQAKRAGKSPGLLIYTGQTKNPTEVHLIHYSKDHCNEEKITTIDEIDKFLETSNNNWIKIEGFKQLKIIAELQNKFQIHPLTIEDILTSQRTKIETFDHYIFVTLKILSWQKKQKKFSINQVSLILMHHCLLTFSSGPLDIFKQIQTKLENNPQQRLREQGIDYLFYRLIDTIIDQYFIVLEGIGELIDQMEIKIISKPNPDQVRHLYRVKREILLLRKAIWPMREAVNHLSQLDDKFITSFTRLYLRDIYDHAMQAIDTVETYRDMLSSMLDIYLSSMTNRLNEVMKTLTVISTIFIPITFIASLYGMNFINMPELKSPYGYTVTLCVMGAIVIGMILYFKKQKWF